MSEVGLADPELKYLLKEIRKKPILTPEREREISKLVRRGGLNQAELDKIQSELVEGNMRFVLNVAKKYQGQGLSICDLISEGNLGLVKAARLFDWNQDNRFISYAIWWIKQSIIQSLNDNSRVIRLPANVIRDMQKAKKELEKISEEFSPEAIFLSDECFNYSNTPTTINTEMEISEDGYTLLETINNDNAEMPDNNLTPHPEIIKKTMNLLDILDDRERFIIESYFGLKGDAKTLEDIGEEIGCGLTKERVRQIKDKALRKLRSQSFNILEYLD
jgi:RNA polymerase primary sigma factor